MSSSRLDSSGCFDRLLLSTTVQAFAHHTPTLRVFEREVAGEQRLILEQDCSDRADIYEDDIVVLDQASQHALYLILKNRFEEV